MISKERSPSSFQSRNLHRYFSIFSLRRWYARTKRWKYMKSLGAHRYMNKVYGKIRKSWMMNSEVLRRNRNIGNMILTLVIYWPMHHIISELDHVFLEAITSFIPCPSSFDETNGLLCQRSIPCCPPCGWRNIGKSWRLVRITFLVTK